MRKIFIVLFLVMWSVGGYSFTGGISGSNAYNPPKEKKEEKKKEKKKILVKGKLYSKEWLNNNFVVLEERTFSFGTDYLIYHEKTKTVWAIRKEPNQTKYRLLKEWETYKGGRYIKSMRYLGYYFDLKYKKYIDYQGN